MAGRRSAGLRILRELKDRSRNHYVSSYQSALVHAGLGEKDAAFASLEAAYQEGSTLLTYLKMDPRWDILRSDPRFADLLRRLGLPPAK